MGTDADDIERIAPTPWEALDDDEVLDAQNEPVCNCCIGRRTREESATINARIIACVNFCARVPTEVLEKATHSSAKCNRVPDDTGYLRQVAKTPVQNRHLGCPGPNGLRFKLND